MPKKGKNGARLMEPWILVGRSELDSFIGFLVGLKNLPKANAGPAIVRLVESISINR